MIAGGPGNRGNDRRFGLHGGRSLPQMGEIRGRPASVNFRQLDYFLAVARTGSFTAAAVALKVAQPTLTKSIRGLEQELGVTLFDRLPRGAALTAAGAALRRHAERVGVQMRDAAEELRSIGGGAGGLVSIGAGPAWSAACCPKPCRER